ncbi:MAG: hypothetical protein J6Y20_07805 [Lachnospiraceae bacterium]|jgi:hypothetical protein|nr:hypothetical protein [Lachnospiraceae bacterium]
MFKTMNQDEMMIVNGGGHYIPVYADCFTRYILKANGYTVKTEYNGYKCIGTQWVADTDTRKKIDAGTKWYYKYV